MRAVGIGPRLFGISHDRAALRRDTGDRLLVQLVAIARHGSHATVLAVAGDTQANQHRFERVTVVPGRAAASIARMTTGTGDAIENRAEAVERIDRSGRGHPVRVE